MKQVYIITILILMSLYGFTQRNFRVKNLTRDKNTLEFLLPPHSKIAPEGIFNLRKKLKFKKNSKFRYQYILFKGLKTIHPNNPAEVLSGSYRFTAKSIAKPIHIPNGGESLPTPMQVSKKLGLDNPIRIDKFCSYYTNDVDNLMLQIDTDSLLDNSNWIENYNKLKKDLSIALDELSITKNWPRGIAPLLMAEVSNFLPMPQQCSNKELTIIDKDKSFVILSERIWLLVDSTQKRVVRVDSLGNIENVFPRISVRPIPSTNDSFSFNELVGRNLFRIRKDQNGFIKQSEVHNFSDYTKNLPENFINVDKSIVLLSGSADIQLSSLLKDKIYYAFYQQDFRPNNDLNSFSVSIPNPSPKDANSQLLFFDNINTDLFESLKLSEPANSNKGVISGVFGLRNIIQLIIPVYVNNNYFPSPFRFNFSIYDHQQMGDLPKAKKIVIYRLFRSKLRKIKSSNEKTILLSEDKIKYKY